MKKFLFLLFWILFAVSCEPPKEDPLGVGTLQGFTFIKTTNEPISGLKVTLPNYSDKITDSEGYFKFDNVVEGNYTVSVYKESQFISSQQTSIVEGNITNLFFPIDRTLLPKDPLPVFSVVDVSKDCFWNYWVVGQEEYFFIDEYNSLPKTVFYHSIKANKDYCIMFDDKGLPTKVFTDNFIFMFDNFNGNKVDLGILSPTGEIQIIRNIQTDFVWPTGSKGTQSKADFIRWTGRIIGAIPCVAAGASALASGGLIVTLDILALWTCGNYFVKMADNFFDDANIENGFTKFVEKYKLQSTSYNCGVNPDPSSCLLDLANHGLSTYADYIEELEIRKADLARLEQLINSNVPLKEVTIQPGPEGKDAWISLGSFDDCIEFYDRSSNDSLISIVYDGHGSCSKQIEQMFLQISVARIPSTSIISSAKLEIYGEASINVKDEVPTINIAEVKTYWDEETISWPTHPEAERIASVDFINKSIRSWYSIDITSLVQDWVSLRKDNFGFGISTSEKTVYAKICSGDHPDPTKRPKLIVSYY